MTRYITLFPVLLILGRGVAFAQDPGKVGVTLGYPGTIGVIWQAAKRLAIRPAFSLSHTSSESTSAFASFTGPGISFTQTSTTSSTGWTSGTELGLLLYLRKWENVRMYVAPGYGYQRSSSKSTTTTTQVPPGFPLPTPRTETRESKSYSHAGTVLVGVEYTPHRRFSVFSESGVRYSRGRSGEPFDIRTRVIGNTSRVGAVLYF